MIRLRLTGSAASARPTAPAGRRRAREGWLLRGRIAAPFTVLAVGMCGLVPCSARAVEASGSLAISPPATLGAPFGEHSSLSVGTDSSGEAVLLWSASVGRENEIQSSTLLPGGAEAVAVETIASSVAPISEPVLADQGGAAAVAWFQETSHSSEEEGLVSLRVSTRASTGRWQAPVSVWRAPVGAGYEYAGLAFASDGAGQAIAWLMRREHGSDPYDYTVMVSSRSAGGSFTQPVTLTTDSTSVAPVVAINPLDEATVIWCSPPAQGQLLATTWRGGSTPGPSIVLDEAPSGGDAGAEQFHDLAIDTGEGADELATWLIGGESNRPLQVALRGAWRAPATQFAAAETISSPEVDVSEPAMSLGPSGARVVWNEINAAGEGPLLSAATAAEGAAFTPLAISPLPRSWEEADLARLPDGLQLVTWLSDTGFFASQLSADGTLSTPVLLAQGGDEAHVLAEQPGGLLVAWIGRSALDFAPQAIRYERVTNEALPVPVAPLVELTGGKDIAVEHAVRVRVRCSEACRVTAKAQLFGVRRESARFAAGKAYRQIGSFAPLRRRLQANQTTVLGLHASKRLLAAYCASARDETDGIEVRVAAHAAHGEAVRRVVLGLEPTGARKACRR